MSLLLDFSSARINVNSPVVHVSVFRGEVVNQDLIIINEGNRERDINIGSMQSKSFFSFEDVSVRLEGGESHSVSLNFNSLELNEGVYTGSVSILSSGDKEEMKIPVILEVESNKLLFDVFIRDTHNLRPIEDSLSTQITVYNLRSLNTDAILKMVLYDLDGNIISQETQEINVLNSIEINPVMKIEQIQDGQYILAVSVLRGNSVGTSTAIVNTGNERVGLIPNTRGNSKALIYAVALVVILLVALLIINYYWTRRLKRNADYWSRHLKNHKKAPKIRSVKTVQMQLQKLEMQKSLLEKAYDREYIKRDSYLQGAANINNAILKLKKRL